MGISDVSKNAIYLYIAKGSSFLLQFLLIPHLSRVLSIEVFGLLFFAQSVANYIRVFLDFGFELYGPREIAITKEKKEKEQIFVSIMASRFLLGFLCMLVSLVIPCFIKIDLKVFWAWEFSIFVQVITPLWFFQGVQKLKIVSFILSISRLLIIGTTIYFVRSDEDVFYYPFIEGCYYSFSLALTFIYYFNLGFRFHKIMFKDVLFHLKGAWELFLSKLSISLYTTSSIFFLGVMSGNKSVGIFAPAMKLIELTGNILGPINQVVYPYIAIVNQENVDIRDSLKKYIKLISYLAILTGGGFLLMSNIIVKSYLGVESIETLNVFKILCIVPSMILLSNVLGIQVILGMGYKKEFTQLITKVGLFGAFILASLVYMFDFYGAAVGTTLVELIIVIGLYKIFIKKIIKGKEIDKLK